MKAANVNVESYWPSLFAKLCQKKNIDELIMNVGASGDADGAAATVATNVPADSKAVPAAEETKKKKVRIYFTVFRSVTIIEYKPNYIICL